jgi:hypothetical protein
MVRVDQPSEMRLKTYNFPGWIASIDGQRVSLWSDSDGAQVLSVPEGRHKVETDFVDTPPRKFGAVLSGLGLLVILGLAVVDYRRQGIRSLTYVSKFESVPTDSRESDRTEQQQIGKAAQKKTKSVVTILGLVVIVAIAAFIAIQWFGSKNRPSDVNKSDPGAAETAGAAAGGGGVGSEARLSVGSLASIPVAVDEKSLDELMSALPTKNDERVEQLIQSGRVFRVNRNTKVRIIEFGPGRIKVRVLEGDNIMREVWVPERWIK